MDAYKELIRGLQEHVMEKEQKWTGEGRKAGGGGGGDELVSSCILTSCQSCTVTSVEWGVGEGN